MSIGMLGATAGYAPTTHFYPALWRALLQGSTHIRTEKQFYANLQHKILNVTVLLM